MVTSGPHPRTWPIGFRLTLGRLRDALGDAGQGVTEAMREDLWLHAGPRPPYLLVTVRVLTASPCQPLALLACVLRVTDGYYADELRRTKEAR